MKRKLRAEVGVQMQTQSGSERGIMGDVAEEVGKELAVILDEMKRHGENPRLIRIVEQLQRIFPAPEADADPRDS